MAHLHEWEVRSCEGKQLKPDRAVLVVQFHREAFFPALRVRGQRSEGEPDALDLSRFLQHVDDAARVDGPHPEVTNHHGHGHTRLDRRVRVAESRPGEPVHRPAAERLRRSGKDPGPRTQPGAVVINGVPWGRTEAADSDFRIGEREVLLCPQDLSDLLVCGFMKQKHFGMSKVMYAGCTRGSTSPSEV